MRHEYGKAGHHPLIKRYNDSRNLMIEVLDNIETQIREAKKLAKEPRPVYGGHRSSVYPTKDWSSKEVVTEISVTAQLQNFEEYREYISTWGEISGNWAKEVHGTFRVENGILVGRSGHTYLLKTPVIVDVEDIRSLAEGVIPEKLRKP